MSAFQRMIDANFRVHGVDAFYRRDADAPVGVRVIRWQPDIALGVGPFSVISEGNGVDIRVSEMLAKNLGAPRKGHTIEIGGEAFEIQEGARRDSERMVWKLPLVPA